MKIIHCNVKPHYQQSRSSLRHQIFPLLIQEGLCKVLEIEPFRVIGPQHPPVQIFKKYLHFNPTLTQVITAQFTLGKITCYFSASSCV